MQERFDERETAKTKKEKKGIKLCFWSGQDGREKERVRHDQCMAVGGECGEEWIFDRTKGPLTILSPKCQWTSRKVGRSIYMRAGVLARVPKGGPMDWIALTTLGKEKIN